MRQLTRLILGYRATLDEAGPGKPFDFSRSTLTDRWQAGFKVMREGLRRIEEAPSTPTSAPGFKIYEIDC